MPQIDFLRAMAVLMVLVHHWTTDCSLFWFNAELGVQLFFVISGYLITGILLDARSRAEELGQPRTLVLRRFYTRRFLRIFPLYYLTLFVAWIGQVPTVTDSIGWHLAYLTNVYLAITGAWHGHVSHFWSLAVEEQFYFVWPWLMLFIPRRALFATIIAAILTAPVYVYLAAYVFHFNPIALDVIPFASLYTLGAGSLLALLERRARLRDGVDALHRAVVIAGLIGGAGYVGLRLLEIPGFPFMLTEKLRQLVMLPLALSGLVFAAARRVPGPVGRVMTLPPFLYLGRISYGLYIFHPFMEYVLWLLCAALGLPFEAILHSGWIFPVKFVLLVGCASLTWNFFERPINNLKRRAPYVN